MANLIGGFDIKRVNNMYMLDGELEPNPNDVSRMLGIDGGNTDHS